MKKKQLVAALAAAFVVGVAGTAFAANPFVDVPAKHWSYEYVNKLAKAGVVDGYGDGTFRGDKQITRYEMAVITAKAMAKLEKADAEQKAMINKLSAEFGAELQKLGVEVAGLKAKAAKDTLNFSGDARVRWVKDESKVGSAQTAWAERLRINMNAQVNQDTTFNGRLIAMNHNEFGTTTGDDVLVDLAYFTTNKPFGLDATATYGRIPVAFGQTGYWFDDSYVDGAKVTFGNKLKVTTGFANFGVDASKLGDSAFVEATYPVTKDVTVSGMYFKETNNYNAADTTEFSVYGAGVKAKLSPVFTLLGDWGKNTDAANDPTFYVGRLAYKGANKAVPQSWGLNLEYRKFENGAYGGGSGAMIPVDNTKGWAVSGSVTLAKNIVADALYTWDDKVTSTGAEKGDYTRLQVNFSF